MLLDSIAALNNKSMLNGVLLLMLTYVLRCLFIIGIISLLVASPLLLSLEALLRSHLKIPKMGLLDAKLLDDCLDEPYLKTLFILELILLHSKCYSPLLRFIIIKEDIN